ncbi:stage V sporulation protein AA [Metabacillus litoralis]|uniref:stage V sporulation protein AA n=1 Tax=Metabacillus TaxID=2675233 RepID=UPI000EF5A9D7|nr:stage V sporulation protein AA [Metabacillus litoralis]MCM3163174.1 stage V sporulation protein AA [Metabacillus litoralis]MCM3413431.1 stage V sporulation protein AA [Metabacillus litoralis]UHA58039.1 stage V sporulation protein AA [Metabacillus litoralis]
MEKTVYIRLRHRIQVHPNDVITIDKIALVVGDKELTEKLNKIVIHKIQLSDKNMVVIDVMHVLREIHKYDRQIDVQAIGATQTIVEIMYQKKKLSPLLFCLVWLLLFIGAGLAIMNFHEDVSMRAVHQRIYKIVTGKENAHPLILQIPYSLGLGLGMVLFFNHLFKKRINEEPSPLEVEIFNYQLDLDQYVAMNENKENINGNNDDSK